MNNDFLFPLNPLIHPLPPSSVHFALGDSPELPVGKMSFESAEDVKNSTGPLASYLLSVYLSKLPSTSPWNSVPLIALKVEDAPADVRSTFMALPDKALLDGAYVHNDVTNESQ